MKLRYLIAIPAVIACAQTPPERAAAAPEAPVATVAGQDVTASDIRKMLEVAGPQFIQAFQRDPKYAIQQLYITQYLAVEGERLKLGERSPLKEQLDFQRRWAIATAMVNQEQNSYQVPDADVQKYYQEHPEKFVSARVKTITIAFKATVQGSGTSAEDVKNAAAAALNAAHAKYTQEEAFKIAGEIIAKVKEGVAFEKLMAQYAEDELEKSGAEFPISSTGATPEEIKKAVFALKNPGDVTDIIRAPGHLYIVRLEKRTAQPLDEVRMSILMELRNQHFQIWFAALMKKYEPVIKNPEFFARPNGTPAGPAKP
jgi:hypothetical protein